jgi:DHA1 family bicyclomycin/chloramphenicol resistance-like MFS transporter
MSASKIDPRTGVRLGLGLILLLAAFSALGQFANSIYLPSLPAIADDLGAPMSAVQLTLSVFMASFAASMLIAGPLADRFGRRPILAFGFGAYLLATLGCALAPDIDALTLARALQSVGAGFVSVAGRAVTRDLHDGPELARAMAAIMIAFAAVPGLAPLLGGVIQQTLGWRVGFGVAALFGIAVWIAAALRLPETIAQPLARLDIGAALGVYRPIVTSRAFWRPSLVGAAIMGALFAFLAGSPEVFIGRLGVSPAEYGIYPAVTILGFIGGGVIARGKAGRWTPETTISRAILIVIAGTGAMFAIGHADLASPLTYSAAMFVFVLGMGLAMPAAGALAVMPFAHIAGTAGGLTGVLQMLGAASGAFLVSVLAPLGLHAFPTAMLSAGLATAVFWIGLGPKEPQ